MGVMACSRRDCSRVMCDTYVDNIGYICNDCKEEFTDMQEHVYGNTERTEKQIKEDLKRFMETDKGTFIEGEKLTIGEFFDKNTR